jgi:predicted O-linked N-acetylglucosamine transferase (SPINDLY family)
MAEVTIQQAFDLAVGHHEAGRLAEAEQVYRQILAHHPEHFGSLHLLGVLAHQAGRNEIAVELIGRAIKIRPDIAEARSNLGVALKSLGRLDQSIAAFREAIALRPDYAQAYFNLGIGLAEQKRFDDAIVVYRRAIDLNPTWPEAHNNLANVLKATGHLDEAIGGYRHAVALRPDYADALSNLGTALSETGQLDEAIATHRTAVGAAPGLAVAHNNLGIVLRETGKFEEAIAACRRAIALNPNLPDAYNSLGNALKDVGKLDEAIAAYRRAIELNPSLTQGLNNLGFALFEEGQLDEAIAVFRRGIAIDPDNASLDSNLVFALQFHPAYDARAIAQELGRWNRQHAEPLRKFIEPLRSESKATDGAGGRRLRVGYVSPDFQQHVVGRNVLPWFEQHNRGQFEIFCYSLARRTDALTKRFQQNADGWRNIAGMSDEQAAEQIRADGIDFLVDLALHTANNRLLIFARKPAPVQVTFAGYPASTGLTSIDYRLSDPFLDPPGMDESVYSERTMRLADSFWCYDPLEERGIPVNSLPALTAGVFTFGCLNNFCKVNDGVLALWARVMREVGDSRLLLLTNPGSHRQRTVDRLAQEGVSPARIEFIETQSRRRYLELYHRIDLALDTFPYNGHTTSLDALWMGVPVVTLVGDRSVSRAGWSQLSNLRLTELAARTGDEFVRVAVELARDLPRLGELRSTLRRRMEQSVLMDAHRFARNIEAAYRQMWSAWHQGKSAADVTVVR